MTEILYLSLHSFVPCTVPDENYVEGRDEGLWFGAKTSLPQTTQSNLNVLKP